MKLTARTTAYTLLFAAVILLLVSGCSRESSLEPVFTASTVEPSQIGATSRPVPATSFVETFDNRRNVGGWSFNTTHRPIYEETGGNPGGYLHDDHVVTFAPSPGTRLGEESIFTGNYRERKVTSLGIDLRSINYEYDITNRYLALMIMNDNGTPSDVIDDWGAYVIGDVKLPSKYLPMLASSVTANEPGWISYDFDIQSQTNGLPEGWTFMRWTLGDGEMPGGSWAELMQNVSYVQFYYGDPEMYYILQAFDLGLDNPRISWEE